MDELKDIAEWLITERGNWTQIASRCEVSTKTINRIAHAKTESISLRTLNKLRKERAAMQATREFEATHRQRAAVSEAA